MRLTRRQFLKTGATVVGAGALLPVVFQKALVSLNDQRVHGAAPDDGKVLVVVQMAGGNDGLNMVVPVADGRYYDARPGLAVPQAQALPLNDTTGLNPSMVKLKDLWDLGVVAIVEGVGYPTPNFSHFVSMDIWQEADPAQKLSDGWLGRYFDRTVGKQEAPFLGLAIGSALPTAFRSYNVAVPSLENIATYQFQSDPRAPSLAAPRLQALKAWYASGHTSLPAYGPLLDETFKAADISIVTLQNAHSAYKASVQYPTGNTLASALQLVAEAISANVGVKVCHVSIGGFDTHANQTVDQPRQLGFLATALNAFYLDLQAKGLDSKVLIMTWSEFGRRVKSNASTGTDHGSAAPLFFIGTPVKGGLYGQRPDLGNLDNGNLKFTTDFRTVYATALDGWLNAPSKDLLRGVFQPIPLWKAA